MPLNLGLVGWPVSHILRILTSSNCLREDDVAASPPREWFTSKLCYTLVASDQIVPLLVLGFNTLR